MPTFLVTALFKTETVERWDAAHPGEYIEHLKTTVPAIRLEGLLLDRAGKRCGIFAMLESSDFVEIDRWVAISPYQVAGLYDRIETHRMDIQAGSLP